MNEQIQLANERDQDFEEFLWPWEKKHTCELCEEKATRGAPIIDQPAFDKMRGVRWLRKLYNAPPRFTVKERGPKRFCALHHSLAEQLADNEVAERRNAQAQLNSREFMKVHVFNRRLLTSVRNAEAVALAPFEVDSDSAPRKVGA